VRARFLTAPRPAMQARGTIAKQVSAAPRKKIDYTPAQSEVLALNRTGKLNDSTVNRFAVRSEYASVVAALSLLSDVKVEAVEPLIEPERLYGLIGVPGQQVKLVDNDDDHPQSARLRATDATGTRASSRGIRRLIAVCGSMDSPVRS
jgi:hypothetical protein